MMMKSIWAGRLRAGLATAMALALVSCGSDSGADQLSDAAEDAEITRFNEGLEATGLDGLLEGEGSYTLLAPSDEAFAALGESGETLLDDPERRAILAAVLREHILPGAISLDAIRETIGTGDGSVDVVTFGNGELSFEADGDDLVVTSASGQRAVLGKEAVSGENGVIIPIDAVLVAPSAIAGSAEPEG